MVRGWKRTMVAVLTVVVVFNSMPTAAFASLIDNTPQENSEILRELEEIAGSEEEAQTYYTLLEQYGLLDEDGNLAEKWAIERDGEPVTLEEVRRELEGDYDPNSLVVVDGTPVALKDLATMLEIEDYVAELREKYFSDGVWTQEQLDALDSLRQQVAEGGIQVIATDPDLPYPSGMNHAARVEVGEPEVDGATVTFPVTLSHANSGQKASFAYAVHAGSQRLAEKAEGTITLDAENPAGVIEVELDEMVAWDEQTAALDVVSIAPSLYMSLDNLKGALFANGRTATTLVYEMAGTLEAEEMPESGAFDIALTKEMPRKGEVALSDAQRNAIRWGMTNEVETILGIEPTVENMLEYEQNPGQGDFAPATDELRRKYQAPRSFDGGLWAPRDCWVQLDVDGSPHAYKGYTSDGGRDKGQGDSDLPGFVKEDFRTWEGAIEEVELDMWDADMSYEKLFQRDRVWQFASRDGYAYSNVRNDYTEYPISATIAFHDTAAPKVESISAPAGTYYPGQVVPVAVRLSEPVKPSDIKLRFNGEDREYAGAGKDDTLTNVVVVEYSVAELDGTALSVSGVSGQDTAGNKLEEYVLGDPDAGVTMQELTGVVLSTPDKLAAFTSMSAALEGTVAKPELKVDVALATDEKLTAWIATEEAEPGAPGTLFARDLFVSLDGGKTLRKLYTKGESLANGLTTGPISCDLNTGSEAITHIAELYVAPAQGADSELALGRYATTAQEPVVYVEADDMKLEAPILTKDGEPYEYADDSKTVYAQDEPNITGSVMVEGEGFAFGDTSKTTVWATDGETGERVPQDAEADFVWGTTDASVLTIDATGKATPTGKAGSAAVTVTAWNGGLDGRTATVTGEELKFGSGLTPFLLIPNNNLTVEAGQNAQVYWTSNLCDKNGDAETSFAVTVTRDDAPKGTEPVFETTVTGTSASPAAQVTIPSDELAYSFGGQNCFTVRVMSEYQGKTYEATASITLSPRPAQVSLDKLPSYYITDAQGEVPVSWSISSFERAVEGGGEGGEGSASSEELFELKVTRDGAEEPVYVGGDPGAGEAGVYRGSWSLALAAVDADPSDPASYRDVYTVTVKAKNGTDSTWSYDSFVLYVYDADALQIMVDGVRVDDGLTMSNRAAFSKMSQDDILALKRDISLRNVISANYGEYAWTEVADQISWASSNSGVASVNYQQGTLYENIENFEYASYRPTADFVLSGLESGSTTVTATHKLTQMADSVDVTVETMKDRLYLFQCYPQTMTTLSFEEWTDAERTEKKQVKIESDERGAAAYYAEFGIASDVWCETELDGATYLGTFYLSQLQTGERDSTKLELYPCNNLQLRRAAYAYLYLKNPDGTPYAGEITFRGGVYVNDEYKEGARFQLNGGPSARAVNLRGDEDQRVKLDKDGRLEVVMDQTQWGLEGGSLKAGDQVRYMFQIEKGDGSQADYYPLLTGIDATTNEDAYLGAGEAAVSFRRNDRAEKHPFIASQVSTYENTGAMTSVLDAGGKVGPSDSCPDARLTTAVMWWGEDLPANGAPASNRVELVDGRNRAIAARPGEYELKNSAYPFSNMLITQHMVRLNAETLGGVLDSGQSTKLKLNYFVDGVTLTRSEEMPFKLVNMIGKGRVEDHSEIGEFLANMGNAAGTDAGAVSNMDFGDKFFNQMLEIVASDTYTTGSDKLFSIKLAPTSDPTKFLGFIEANVGNMSDKDQVTGVYAQPGETTDFDYMPGLGETLMLVGRKTPLEYAVDQLNDYYKATRRKAVRNVSFDLGGYAESLIYYNEQAKKWEIQILDGGFNAGGGMSASWNVNAWCGPVPFTATLTAGGTGEVSMDALTAAYRNVHTDELSLGTDFLTQLRLYLYMRFFAGVGFDYSIVAFKLGVFGQVNADMRFQWLNRPGQKTDVANNADGDTEPLRRGQHFAIDGQAGLEFLVKLLFVSYETVLAGTEFSMLNESTGDWERIQYNWEANSRAAQGAIEGLLDSGSASLVHAGGGQMVMLNMAPAVEGRDYLAEGDRAWGTGRSLFSLDGASVIENLETNTYPYANPVLSDDGRLVAYLSDMGSADVEQTRVKVGERADGSFGEGVALEKPVGDENDGYGDSQVAMAGTGDFAVAAWTRQTASIDKDAGAVLTDADQAMMLNATDVYASVRTGSGWEAVRLSNNSNADMAPAVATNGKSGADARAIVVWRSVEVDAAGEGSAFDPLDFDRRDAIVYRVFDGVEWGAEQTLYNGTSGAVKALVATMMDNGTAAVAYTLDTDGDDASTDDREIAYAVVDPAGDVARAVRATTDAYLDENPQIESVYFGDEERFVLGWYSEEAVAVDSAAVLDGGAETPADECLSDIRLIDFDVEGNAGQKLPDSISQVADSYGVNISSNFRFSKNAKSIDDLSILWAERAEVEPVEIAEPEEDDGTDDAAGGAAGAATNAAGGSGDSPSAFAPEADHDRLRAVKFYRSGEGDAVVRLTGAITLADMEEAAEGTLIDHFDACVDNASSNTVKAVILASTYGVGGETVTRTAQTVGGETVSYAVPARTTSMYTATESYGDVLEVPNMVVDWETVRRGGTVQFQFTVVNSGIHAINRIEIRVGDTATVHDDLSLMPGSSMQLSAEYDVPADGVVDPTYTVTASFDAAAGATGTATLGGSAGFFGVGAQPGTNVVTGTAYLDLPDVEVAHASIVGERDGRRVIQAKLNNHSDAKLAGSGRAVRLGFYTDAACETLLKSMGEEGFITIENDVDLAMLDEGGFAVQETFDIAAFMTDKDGEVHEIPETGIAVYLKAEVLDTEANGRAVQGEPIVSDNFDSVRADNLAVRTGEEVSITTDLATRGADSTVRVEVQNNRLASKTSGNLIVMLLDKDGNVLAEQQSYREGAANDGLIKLDGEEVATCEFTFEGVTDAADVRVMYSDAALAGDNADLQRIEVEGVELEHAEGTDGIASVWAGAMTDVPSAPVTVVAANPAAAVEVTGQDGKPVELDTEHSFTGMFVKGENAFTITVTAPDGTATVHSLVLNHTVTTDNTALSALSVSGVELAYDAESRTFRGSGVELADGALTVVTEDPRATVTVDGEPYKEGMELAFAKGENVFEVVVTAVDGKTTAVYRVAIQNNEKPPVGPGGDGGPEQPGSGGESLPGGGRPHADGLPSTGDKAWAAAAAAFSGAAILALGLHHIRRRV